MSYVKHILLPGEQMLYDGHVHPTVLLPGLMYLGFAALILTKTGNTGGAYSLLLAISEFGAEHFAFMNSLHNRFLHWQDSSPTIDLDIKVIALGIALWGFWRLVKGFILMETTELIVTDQRIIAKIGVFTITTVEMDRRRVAGVTVHQTFAGRVMGYGYVVIQGFTSHIVGLPPLVKPYLLEKFIG